MGPAVGRGGPAGGAGRDRWRGAELFSVSVSLPAGCGVFFKHVVLNEAVRGWRNDV